MLPATTVSVSWICPLRANRDLKGLHGLWFLKAADGKHWTLLSPTQGTYPIEFAYFPSASGIAGANFAASMQATTNGEFVAAELGSALESYKDPGRLHHLAAALLSLGDSGVTQKLYGQLRTSSDPELRFVGLAGLVRNGNGNALGEVARDINSLPKLQMRMLITSAVAGCRMSDLASIEALGHLSTSPDIRIQAASAEALKAIHTRQTLPYLASLLSSSDRRTREYALQGMSRFADNLPITTEQNIPNGQSLQPRGVTPYRTADTDKYSLSRKWLGQTDEAPYLQFWKNWWVNMKPELTKLP